MVSMVISRLSGDGIHTNAEGRDVVPNRNNPGSRWLSGVNLPTGESFPQLGKGSVME